MLAQTKPAVEIPKAKYDAQMESLRIKLQRLGRRIFEAQVPVLLIFEGWEGAGKGDVINFLMSHLDPRGTRAQFFNDPTQEERLRPFFWRYWLKLPAKGQIAVFDRCYYESLIEARVEGEIKHPRFLRGLEASNTFERHLIEDGTLIVKFWLQIGRKEQKKRFQEWRDDPATAFRVTRRALRQNRDYKDWLDTAEEALAATNTPVCPWTVIEATDRRARRLKATKVVCEAFERAVAARDRDAKIAKAAKKTAVAAPALAEGIRATSGPNPLDRLKLTLKLGEDRYEAEQDVLEGKLRELQHLCYTRRLPVVIIFEGSDAAGKGGAIRRLMKPLDPRGYTVIPIAAPQGEEKTHHYLWRFWRHLPKAGHWAIYDRTWYGRVLVERVEGFCRPQEWGRAYGEIRDFETSIVRSGAVLVKFWLQISSAEQLKRFKDRQKTPHKNFKITEEDWRNREKAPLYRDAVGDMLLETSTPEAPWTLVEADDKRWARVKVLKTVVEAVETKLAQARKPAGGFRL